MIPQSRELNPAEALSRGLLHAHRTKPCRSIAPKAHCSKAQGEGREAAEALGWSDLGKAL